MLRINDVIQYEDHRYRVLDFSAPHLIWINLDSEKAFPEVIRIAEIEELVHEEKLKLMSDPYAYLFNEQVIEGSKAQVIRDERMSLIAPLLPRSGLYFRMERGKLVQERCDETGCPKKTLYKLLRQYWQRGCVPNALLPDYRNSGGKGQRKESTKKLGRPRSISPGTGFAVDAAVERMFRIVIDRHYSNDKGVSLPYVHRRFCDMFQLTRPDVASSDYPSLAQLRYFWEREYSKPERVRLKANKITYQKDLRPLIGTATAGVSGPGSRYEIDATIADVYLLSADRQRIIGRPTLYVVVDVFSRMVAGFYIGLESPSYVTALQALNLAMTNKVELCHSYDFEIQPEDWPTVGIPDALLADRGELLGHQIESLENAFGVRIENTRPYGGDAKGIVERYFRTLQADFKPFAPGVVTATTVKKRGGKDYRLDATLTLREFSKVIVGAILRRNLNAVLDKYDRSADMPDDLVPTPIEIWRWGIRNRSGRLRNVPSDLIRIALLPRQKVTVSNLGINCFGEYYTSPELLKSGWLHRDSSLGRVKLEAAYDPADAGQVYLFPEKRSSEYWVCSLSDRSRQFRGRTMWELWASKQKQRKAVAKAKVDDEVSKRKLENMIEETIKNAVRSAPRDKTASKDEQVRGIKHNRIHERDQERQKLKPQSDHGLKQKADVTYLHDKPEDGGFPDFLDDLF